MDGLDRVAEGLDLVYFHGEGQGGADGAEAELEVGAFEQSVKGEDGLEHGSLELGRGEAGGLLLELGQSVAEVLVFEPTVEGATVHVGEAGGFGDGGSGGEDGEGHPLAVGEAGGFRFRGRV